MIVDVSKAFSAEWYCSKCPASPIHKMLISSFGNRSCFETLKCPLPYFHCTWIIWFSHIQRIFFFRIFFFAKVHSPKLMNSEDETNKKQKVTMTKWPLSSWKRKTNNFMGWKQHSLSAFLDLLQFDVMKILLFTTLDVLIFSVKSFKICMAGSKYVSELLLTCWS